MEVVEVVIAPQDTDTTYGSQSTDPEPRQEDPSAAMDISSGSYTTDSNMDPNDTLRTESSVSMSTISDQSETNVTIQIDTTIDVEDDSDDDSTIRPTPSPEFRLPYLPKEDEDDLGEEGEGQQEEGGED